MKVEKEGTLKFLKKLNRDLLMKFSEMKVDFEKNPPNNNEIKKKFMVKQIIFRNGRKILMRLSSTP